LKKISIFATNAKGNLAQCMLYRLRMVSPAMVHRLPIGNVKNGKCAITCRASGASFAGKTLVGAEGHCKKNTEAAFS
jgi:hypothetical protein